jgi:2-furoyl-CoA dehydrogenase large subunit
MSQAGGRGAYLGRPLARVEDGDLLCGRGRFGDDLPVRMGTLHAAVLRSPHAHAELLTVDSKAASAILGVATIVTGDDAKRLTRPFTAAVKAPVEHWCLAVDRVRYVGEPIAVVLARDRYTAADALELIEVSYRPLPAAIDPVAAASSSTPLLHPELGCNATATARSATAIPKPLLPPLRTGSRSRPLTRAIPAARSRGLW